MRWSEPVDYPKKLYPNCICFLAPGEALIPGTEEVANQIQTDGCRWCDKYISCKRKYNRENGIKEVENPFIPARELLSSFIFLRHATKQLAAIGGIQPAIEIIRITKDGDVYQTHSTKYHKLLSSVNGTTLPADVFPQRFFHVYEHECELASTETRVVGMTFLASDAYNPSEVKIYIADKSVDISTEDWIYRMGSITNEDASDITPYLGILSYVNPTRGAIRWTPMSDIESMQVAEKECDGAFIPICWLTVIMNDRYAGGEDISSTLYACNSIDELESLFI